MYAKYKLSLLQIIWLFIFQNFFLLDTGIYENLRKIMFGWSWRYF